MSATKLTLHNRHTGEILIMTRIRDEKGQMKLTLDGSLPAGAEGPPLHIHFHEDEIGRVVAGTLGAEIGGERITVPKGGEAVLPAGVPHKWWNAGDDLLEFSGHVSPGVDLDRYLQAIFAIMNAGPPGKPSIFYLAHVAWRHRKTQLLSNPPAAVQRIVFPIIISVGTLLGKYRGADWPGSPESCPGAPFAG